MYQGKLIALKFMLDAHQRNYNVRRVKHCSTFTEEKVERKIICDFSDKVLSLDFCKL